MEYFTKNETGEYVKVEGVLHSDEDFKKVKTSLDEFRTNNVNLLKEKDKYAGFAAIFGEGGVTPDTLEQRIAAKAKEKSDATIATMQQTFDTETADIRKQNETYKSRIADYVLGGGIRKAAAEAGVYETAYEDLFYRAANVFSVDDEGKIVAKDDAKDSKGNPLTLQTWLSDTLKAAPHFVKPSQGPSHQQKRGNPGDVRINNNSGGSTKPSINYFKARA